MIKIISANAEYTGGGIYIYWAKTNEGTFLQGSSEWDALYEVDSDPNLDEESGYIEWQEEHNIRVYEDEEYFELIQELLRWILDNSPRGNYSSGEIKNLLQDELDNHSLKVLDKYGLPEVVKEEFLDIRENVLSTDGYSRKEWIAHGRGFLHCLSIYGDIDQAGYNELSDYMITED